MKSLLFLFAGLLCSESIAAIVNTSGSVQVIAPPSDVSKGAFESDTTIFAFAEQQNVTLPAGFAVDISVPGATPASPSDDNFSPTTIPPGTAVSSYYLHCDAAGSPSSPVHLTGSLTFDHDVLGLMVLGDTTNAAVAYLGFPGTTYPAGGGGLEINSTSAFDSVTLSTDRRTVSVDLRDANSPDDIRIITVASVPEPSAAVLTLFGATLVATCRRRWVA